MAPNNNTGTAITIDNGVKHLLTPSKGNSTNQDNMSKTGKKERTKNSNSLLQWFGALVWPLMLALPLVLTSSFSFTSYADTFPASWYTYDYSSGERPSPLGLTLGILAVAIGQIFCILYFFLHRHGYLPSFTSYASTTTTENDENHNTNNSPPSIQVKGAPSYDFMEGVVTHLSQPEGFVLLAAYLSGTWMFRLMPPSYYSFEGGIQYTQLIQCLILQDGIQYIMHRLEHSISPEFYKRSHKPHHRFTNPRMFDAFNGSLADTVLMILIPLYTTACIVPNCNVWTYMAFGSMYANWLTLIHSEFPLPWDKLFRKLGLGTPGDHHVHHKFFKYNYGHLFMWFDRLCGSYRNPEDFAPKVFSVAV